jgi:hypothetical protein
MRKVMLVPFILMFVLGSAIGVSAQEATPAASPFAGMGYQELHIVATDTEFQAPAQATAGLTLLTIENQSSSDASVTLAGPKEGQTMDEMMQMVATPSPQGPFPPIFYEIKLTGGPTAKSGETKQVLINLTEGDWAAFGEANQAPALITVTAAEGAAPAEPTADLTIETKEFDFPGLPDQIAAGDHLMKVTNTGEQPHIVIISTAPEGLTTVDYINFLSALMSGTPPAQVSPAIDESAFQDVDGLEALSSGMTAWIPLHLEPGTYVAACFIGDKDTGVPHAAEGMAKVFTVT